MKKLGGMCLAFVVLAVALVPAGFGGSALKAGTYYLFQVDTSLGTHFVKVTVLARAGDQVTVSEEFYNDTSRVERTATYKVSEAWFLEKNIQDPELGKASLLRAGADMDVSASATWYGPPYDWSWFDMELHGYGIHDKWATVSTDHTNGGMNGASAAYAGPGFGGARAQVWVMIYDAVSVSATRTYKVEAAVDYSAVATGVILCRPPWGCALSDGSIRFRLEMVAVTASGWTSVGAVESQEWDAPPFVGWYWSWSARAYLTGNFYLTAGTSYYLLVRLHVFNYAAAVGILAYAYSRVETSGTYVYYGVNYDDTSVVSSGGGGGGARR